MTEPTKRKLSHRGARQKGKRGEYTVRDALIKIGVVAKRVPMSGALAWMKGDVCEMNTNPKHVHEVKNCEKLELPEWWRQARSQSLDGEVPTLHFTSNLKPMHTVMRAPDFDDMVYDAEEAGPDISFVLVDLPPRKNFWKFIKLNPTLGNVLYLYEVDGEELAIVSTDLYMLIRKRSLKVSQDAAQPASSQPLVAHP